MSCGCERSDGYVLFDLRPGLFSGHVAQEFSNKNGGRGDGFWAKSKGQTAEGKPQMVVQ